MVFSLLLPHHCLEVRVKQQISIKYSLQIHDIKVPLSCVQTWVVDTPIILSIFLFVFRPGVYSLIVSHGTENANFNGVLFLKKITTLLIYCSVSALVT